MRAETFQSIIRMSSPMMYCRTSENAIPRPLNTEWYCPAIRSRTSRWVTISIRRIRFKSSRGSMAALGCDALRNFDPLEQLAHHRLRRDLLGLGLVGEDHAVAEHVDPDGLDVLGRHIAAVPQERVRPSRLVEEDRGARAGAEGDEVGQLGEAVGLGLARGVDDVDD